MTAPLPGASRLRVVNLGIGMPAALVAKCFAELGATVWTAQPSGGDPFDETFPAYRHWRSATQSAAPDEVDGLIAAADVCILGGESFPDAGWQLEAEELSRAHPRLIVLQIAGSVGSESDRVPAVETLLQARSGIAHEMYSDHPIVFGFQPGNYGAALLGLCGVWAALVERTRSGLGQVVRTSLLQGLALFFPTLWMSAERPDAVFENTYPKDVQQLIFACADGRYVQLVLGVRGALAKLYGVLGIDAEVDPDDSGKPSLARGPRNYFGDIDLIAPAVARFERGELLERLWAAGLGAEPVLDPGECWADEQVAVAGIIREQGNVRLVGLPMTVAPVPPPGLRPGGQTHHRSGEGPLSGIRVVDFGKFVAGPMAGRLLGDLGAEVIKVDPTSSLDTPSSWRTGLVSNRGKKSVRVDLKHPDGQRVAQRLCETADVVMHNFRVGVAARLGIDPDTVHKVNPTAITLETSAYGPDGPKARLTGFDMVVQGMAGLERRSGGPANPPLWARSAIVDYATAALGAAAVLIGLHERALTGCGATADVDLLRSAVFLLSDVLQEGDAPPRSGVVLNDSQNGFHPAERLYRTADGWLAVAARSDAMAQRLAAALGLEARLGARDTWGPDAERAIGDALAALPTRTALDRLRGAEVWCEPCVADGWAAARQQPGSGAAQLVIEVDDPKYGKVAGWFGELIRFGRSQSLAAPRLGAPTPGEFTAEVLRELGVEASEIARLMADGTVISTTDQLALMKGRAT